MIPVGSSVTHPANVQMSADKRIEAFVSTFGRPHLHLAYHAAFPLALTPDMLYLIWVNFKQDEAGKPLRIPWIAVADLLLSALCDEVGHELYQMDLAVRDMLLEELVDDPAFGPARIHALADFLQTYVRRVMTGTDANQKRLAQSMSWTARAYSHPAQVAQEMAAAMKQQESAQLELAHLASLVQTFGRPLEAAGFANLVAYGQVAWQQIHGDVQTAKRVTESVAMGEQTAVGDIVLTVPQFTGLAVTRESADAPADAAALVADESGTSAGAETAVMPGEMFTKVWPVENRGRTTWGEGYSLVLHDGEPMGTTDSQALPLTEPGETAVIEMTFMAPRLPGKYDSTWHLHNSQGRRFGPELLLAVEVLTFATFLARRMDESTWRTLCFDVGVDADNLPGETVAERIESLQSYMVRRGQTAVLLEAIQVAYPELDLSPYEESLAASSDEGQESLTQVLLRYFSEEEFMLLAFDLGIDVEELPGRNRQELAQALQETMQQQGRLDALLAEIAHTRPHLDLTPYGQIMAPSPTRVEPLYRLIRKHFNLEELRTLCFELDIDYENLPGSTLRTKAQALQQYAERRLLMEKLLAYIGEMRPHLDLSPYRQATPQEQANDLAQLLSQYFDREELITLCFELDIDYENLPGQTKRQKAQQLVRQMERNGRRAALLQEIARQRPNIDLRPFSLTTITPQPVDRPPQLYEQISNLFSLAELRDLCFDLNVNMERLPGQTKIRLAMELQKLMQRQRRVEELVRALRRQRPRINWDEVAPAGTAEESVGAFYRPFDFTDFIEQTAAERPEQQPIIDALKSWVADPEGRRIFLIEGAPGSGKTVLAARLASKESPLPDLFSAVHFCTPSDAETREPFRVIESLAVQLGQRYPAYGEALQAAVLSSRRGAADAPNPSQETMPPLPSSTAPDPTLRLEMADFSAADAFDVYVWRPLTVLEKAGGDSPVTILIDGIDELEASLLNVMRKFLKNFSPSFLRLVLTAGPKSRGRDILSELGISQHTLMVLSGWVFTAQISVSGETAVTGEYGANLRDGPHRSANNLGLIPPNSRLIITGPPQGEYTPVRLGDDILS